MGGQPWPGLLQGVDGHGLPPARGRPAVAKASCKRVIGCDQGPYTGDDRLRPAHRGACGHDRLQRGARRGDRQRSARKGQRPPVASP
ncbi:hypothetical protein BHM03_00059050 [Ensete ventricosum]|nr:hypothetical protein BHM03_00059050 [Ensete ventricosum]